MTDQPGHAYAAVAEGKILVDTCSTCMEGCKANALAIVCNLWPDESATPNVIHDMWLKHRPPGYFIAKVQIERHEW